MGHPSLRTKRPLSIHEEFSSRPHVVHLFRDVLCLNDAKLTTYLEEVEFLKAQCQLAEFEDVDPEDTNSGDLVLIDDYHEDLDAEYLEPEKLEKNKFFVRLSDLIEMYQEIDQRADENNNACHIR